MRNLISVYDKTGLFNFLSIDETTKFEALAYQRVAMELQSMPEDVSEVYDKYGIEPVKKEKEYENTEMLHGS